MALSIRTAIRAHNKNTKAALQGEGFDRHFYALQQMAINNNIEIVSENISNKKIQL